MEQIIKCKYKTLIASSNYNWNILYLLHPLNDGSAFFVQENKVIFGQNANSIIVKPQINTTFLSLLSAVSITAISNNTTYKSGRYNLLIYNGSIDDDNFSSFVDLCVIYAGTTALNFDDFFYSMIDIFQLPSSVKELNLIGFFGELSFLVEMWEKYEINLSSIWHIDGSKSKYDFSSEKYNIEIKSSVRESSTFNLKHSQIFNHSNNYIVVISLSNNGEHTLYDLIEYCKSTYPFSENLNFQIRLQEEKLKADPIKINTSKFSVEKIHVYNKDQLETFLGIPDCISEISYLYTFDFQKAISILELVEEIF